MMDLFCCREISSFFAQIAPIIWDRHPSVFSRLVFRHPSHPSHGWAKWVLKSGWNRQDETNGTNGPSGFPHRRLFFPLIPRGFFIRPIDLLGFLVPKTFPKTLTRLFLNECAFPSFPGSFTEEGQQQKASKPWGCPVGFRSIFSKKKRSAMSLRWCKQSCTYWICMRAFVHTFCRGNFSIYSTVQQTTRDPLHACSFESLLKLCRV